MQPAEATNSMREFTAGWGASLVRVAGLPEGVPADFFPGGEVAGLDRACSIAVRLSDRVMEGVVENPTRLYLHHYRQMNYMLDNIALRLVGWLQGQGYAALAVPASQVLDWTECRGHLSHRHVAALAGLGWIGRNNLLVTPQFGARVRLMTVLTDMPLEPDTPLEEDCGSCRACVSVCPARAIHEDPESFDLGVCRKQVREFRNSFQLGHDICGLCIRACKGSRLAV